jgi:hypothetical protein
MRCRFTTPPAFQPAKGAISNVTLVDEGGGVLPYPWTKRAAFHHPLDVLVDCASKTTTKASSLQRYLSRNTAKNIALQDARNMGYLDDLGGKNGGKILIIDAIDSL